MKDMFGFVFLIFLNFINVIILTLRTVDRADSAQGDETLEDNAVVYAVQCSPFSSIHSW